MAMTTHKLSTYKQRLRRLVEQIDVLAFKSAHQDGLVRASPGEVFRTCGKKTCQCSKDPKKRHGPYPVIQVFKNGKQKASVSKEKSKGHLAKSKKLPVAKKISVRA